MTGGLAAGMMLSASAAAASDRSAAGTIGSPALPRPSQFRLRTITLPIGPSPRLGDARGRLRTSHGDSTVDLFPFARGNVHLSAGSRLFGRAGRPLATEPNLLSASPFRSGGTRFGHRAPHPAMLIGYDRAVDAGLTFGVDAGALTGRIDDAPYRLGPRQAGSHGGGDRLNEVGRVTMLYRF